ncbi:hypothetical protein QJS10_CPB11g00820 [Acorus calamus]|uniref:Uncharacterized protein n=1 Tax=Acorus calamus TaxID=4465 RepID=A0AAV9DRN7_ACOCL|nr:hypothetical protein QJS10_CPB11g00820 [Acorus calamus]
MLDKNDEAAPISAEDRDRRIILKGEWMAILRMEESEWRQCSQGQSFDDPSRIEQAFVNYFSSAFKKNNSWAPEWRDEDLGRIPGDLWASLEAPFSETKVKRAVFGCVADKAPGPDGFNLRFFQEFG